AGSFAGANEHEHALIVGCLFKLNNFLLAYQQQDDRAPATDFAAIAARLLKPGIEPALRPIGRRARRGRIRLGLASELLMNHNGVNWAYPWLAGLPARDYELFFYSLDGRADWLTEKFAALGVHRRLPFRPDSYVKALCTIRADDLDVLIFPDVGMTASSRIAALARLAPIQCVGWGHPVTTGSPAIDYYLSSDAMEPPGAEAHYSETLVRLPGVSVFTGELGPPAAAKARGRYGLPEGKLLFGSVQNLFKYLPRHDDLYARIAAVVPRSLVVFVVGGSAYVNEVFAGRMRRAFERRGLSFDERARILPRLPHAAFADLFYALDVNLDTPGWNGANTTVLALSRGCPTVTAPGEFMRGRHGLALLRLVGAEELIAPTPDGYVAMAARLAADPGFRAAMSARVRRGSAHLADSRECCRFLDAFFKEKVAALPQAAPAGR
ncbi:MAG: O-linked N-acetylglucosamine transferase family protein, partial [Rhodospirillales bacterium]